MSVIQKLERLNPKDYLEREKNSLLRHEYVDGEVYAMVGGSLAHNRIANNLNLALSAHLRGTPCRVYIADVKVRVDAANAFYYPDVMVTCAPQNLKAYFITDPCLIIEILSPSTEATDRREKFLAYQKLASLKEYALVAQDRPQVEIFRRIDSGEWEVESYRQDETASFRSVDFSLSIAAVYEGLNGP